MKSFFSFVIFFYFTISLFAQSEIADIVFKIQDGAKIRNKEIISKNKIKTSKVYVKDFVNKIDKYLASQIDYDERGNVVNITDYNSDGSKSWIWTFQYNDNNNLSIKTSRFPQGEIASKEEYEYDNNNLIRLTVYNSENKVISRERYKYDKKGNLIKNKSKDDEEQQAEGHSNIELKYDDKGKIIAIYIIGVNNRRFLIYNFEYDSNDNMVLEEKFGFDGKLEYRFKTEYRENLKSKVNTWDSKQEEMKSELSYEHIK